MFKLTKKKVAAGLVAAGMLATTGIAYAYWSATGSGSGSASAGAGVSVTLTGTSSPVLYPGAPASALSGTVTVSNSATSAYVGVITPSIAEDDPATPAHEGTTWQTVGAHPACSAADYDLQPTAAPSGVRANGATNVPFGTIQLKDTAADQDSCKSQALVLSFSSN